MSISVIAGYIAGCIVGCIGTILGYRSARASFENELIELIKGLPEDVQNEVLAAMNKDIEKSN